MTTHVKAPHAKIPITLILLAGLIYIAFSPSGMSVTSSASSGVLGQKKEKVLRHRKFPVEPIKILGVKNIRKALTLGRKSVEEDDWLKGLSIALKNTSDKTISFIGIELHFIKPGAPEDETITAYQLFYNTKTSPQATIPPKGVAEIKLSDEEYSDLTQTLSRADYPQGATEVEIIVDEVRFDDGTLWRSGQFLQQSSKKKENRR